jgi:hypothetical protein
MVPFPAPSVSIRCLPSRYHFVHMNDPLTASALARPIFGPAARLSYFWMFPHDATRKKRVEASKLGLLGNIAFLTGVARIVVLENLHILLHLARKRTCELIQLKREIVF